jgi:hypothetical protein
LFGAEQKAWRDRLEQEHDNLRAALSWWLEQAELTGASAAAERAMHLLCSLSQFWIDQSYSREMHALLERALTVRVGVAEPVLVETLLYTAWVVLSLNEVERAEALAQEALKLAQQAEDLPNWAYALLLLAFCAEYRDQYTLARARFEEAAARYQQVGNVWRKGQCLKKYVDHPR